MSSKKDVPDKKKRVKKKDVDQLDQNVVDTVILNNSVGTLSDSGSSDQPTSVQPVSTSASASVRPDNNLSVSIELLSDDVIDYLDSEVDRLQETKNLGEKINIHAKLIDTVKVLEKEINEMVDMIDRIDLNDNLKQSISCTNETTDINDDLVNLEKMMEDMDKEEVMQMKIKHYLRIVDIVKRCKAKCLENGMKVVKCN